MMNKTRNFDLFKISLLNQNFDRYCRLYTVFKYVIRNIYRVNKIVYQN